MAHWAGRLDEFVEALRANRRPGRGLAQNPAELDDLRFAARLAGARPTDAQPDPTFLSDLRARLDLAPRTRRVRLSRGHLLWAADLWVAGGLAVRAGLHVATRPAPPAPAAPQLAPGGYVSGGPWFPVAAFSRLPPDAVLEVEAGAVPAFVVRDGNAVHAVSRVCTHMGCLLRYDGAERDFDCPCHGAAFALDGQARADYPGPSVPPLPPLEVRVVQDTVYVRGA